MTTVLVVDDAPAVRFSVSRSLKKAGYEVVEAENGRQALGVLRSQVVDLAVIDLWMPVMDGIELLKTLRVEFPELAAIAMSGGAPKAPIDMSAALATTWGAERVFYKPFDNDDLIIETKNLLAEPNHQ